MAGFGDIGAPTDGSSTPPPPTPDLMQPGVTPGAQPPGFMDVPWKHVGGTQGGDTRQDAARWDEPQPSSGDTSYQAPPTLSGMAGRVGQEMQQTYANADPLLTPMARNAVANNTGWLGRNIFGPAIDAANVGTKELQALGAGGTALVSELLAGGNPELARDVHAGLQIGPVLASGAPPFMPNTPETMGPQPLPRVSIKVPDDADPVLQGLYKTVDDSGATLKPSVSQDFVSGLGKYQKQSPAGLAVSGENDVTDLVGRLQKLQDSPLTTPGSVQEVDQEIQDSISKADPTDAGKMRKILQDFRARTQGDGLSPDDVNGDMAGFTALKQATDGYAAQQRMAAVQKMLDDTEGMDNRAQAIKSRVQTYLRNPNNTKGWSQDDIDSLSSATEGGFLRDWMKTEGSRLITIGATAAGGWLGGMAGGASQFATGYALRNALENLRVGQLQDTMAQLGQRVPQPGTAPLQPVQPPAPGLLTTAARYGPMAGLLGEPQQQNQ